MAFKVGDKVYHKTFRLKGEVLYIDSKDKTTPYLVGFKGIQGHNGDDICIDIETMVERKGYKNQCWWCKEENLELVEEKKMKNIDVIAKDKDLIDVNNICISCYCLKYNKDSCREMICCGDCEFFLAKNCIDFLNAEYKEPKIKLTKFEYDLLSNCLDALKEQEEKEDDKIKEWWIITGMKEKGYFKNIDTNKTIKDILDNCEVIE